MKSRRGNLRMKVYYKTNNSHKWDDFINALLGEEEVNRIHKEVHDEIRRWSEC